MALFLTRCHRILHLTGMQNYVRKQGVQSIRSCHSKVGSIRLISQLSCLVHRNKTELEYSGERKSFHSSVPLLRKFDEKEYESLRILDPAGEFLCNAELYVLKKFCHSYKCFTFDEVKPDSEKDSNSDVGDGALKVFKLSDKKDRKSDGNKDTKTKVIKYHKETSAKNDKTEKIIEILVVYGKVNITFDKKSFKAEELIKLLKELLDIKVVVSPDKMVYLVSLNEVGHDGLQKLFEHVQEKEAKHIAKVKDMLEAIKGQ